MVLDMQEANTPMNHKGLASEGCWVALLGLGIGSGFTVLLQQWNSNSMVAPKIPERFPPPLVALTTDHVDGRTRHGIHTAPLTIVEFSDFQCRYCRLFHEQVFPSLKQV